MIERLTECSNYLILYRQTLAISQDQFQTMAIKWILQQSESFEFFGFPVHIKAMFVLYYSLLITNRIMSKIIMHIA